MRSQAAAQSVRSALSLRIALAGCLVLLATQAPAEPDGAGAESFAASDLLPFTPRHARFRLEPTRGEGRDVEWTRSATGERQAWLLEVPGVQAELLQRAEDGSIVALEVWDRAEGVRIVYDPPALVLPPRLRPGEVSESRSRVAVYDARTGLGKGRGSCIHRVRLVGRESVETPAGRFEAVRIAIERRIDVAVADAEATTEIAFVPGRGRVFERVVRQTRILGFPRSRVIQDLSLLADGLELAAER